MKTLNKKEYRRTLPFLSTFNPQYGLISKFRSLESCPRDLYYNFLLNFCDNYGYFCISQILVIYLHDEFHATDIEAGYIYGMWGLAITFWGLATSWINDYLGIKTSLMIGFTITTICAMIIACTTSKIVLCAIIFTIFPLGNSMGTPMLIIGIKRYTNIQNRGFAYGVNYSVMNVAALLAGLSVDAFNISLIHGLRIFQSTWSGNRLVIVSASLGYFIALMITTFCLRESQSVDSTSDQNLSNLQMSNSLHSGDGDKKLEDGHIRMATLPSIDDEVLTNTDTEMTPSSNVESLSNDVTEDTNDSPVVSCWDIIKSATLWRFCIFCLFLINLRSIFRHLDATLPSYLIRCFGQSYPKGLIYAINPFIIIWLTPIVSALTSDIPHFDMIKYGGYVSAVSPFFMAISTSTWAAVCMVTTLSFGEALWSPRLNDYTMSIAPENKEASFSALASAPLFFAKVPVGFLSGYLLQTYMPSDGDKSHGRILWLIIGLVTISSPILITVFESCVREPSSKKNLVRDEFQIPSLSHNSYGKLSNKSLHEDTENNFKENVYNRTFFSILGEDDNEDDIDTKDDHL